MEYLHVGIEVSGICLTVIGNYWPGESASMDSPGESESVEIEQIVTDEGSDIGAIVADHPALQAEVEAAALEAFKSGRSNAAMERRLAA